MTNLINTLQSFPVRGLKFVLRTCVLQAKYPPLLEIFKVVCLLLIVPVHQSQAQVVLQQDFDSSSVIGTYVSSSPNSGQFNAISGSGGASVSLMDIGFGMGNSVVFDRSGGLGTAVLARTSDMSLQPGALRIEFWFTPGYFSSAASGVVSFQVGSNFTSTASIETVNAAATVSVDLKPAADTSDWWGWTGSSYTFAGFRGDGFPRVTWVVNNRSSSVNYTNPNDQVVSLGAHKFDLWMGDSGLAVQVFQGVAVADSMVPLTDFKAVVNGGTALYALDEIKIEQLGPLVDPPPPQVLLRVPAVTSGQVSIQATGTPSSVWSILRAPSLTGPWVTNVNALVIDGTGAGQYLDSNPFPGSTFYQANHP